MSPRQLVAFAGAFLAPCYAYNLTGSLVGTTDRTNLAVDLRGDGQVVGWSCEKTGADSRATAVADVAQRIAFELGEKGISHSWPSVSAYREARRLLASTPATGEDRKTGLVAARRCLERSLANDPTNLLARFELGNVLRKLGSNDDAVVQYALLERFAAEREVPSLLRRAAIYSRAVALSKLETWPTHHRALRALRALEQDVKGDAELAAADRDHLLALTYSARAATLVFELERLRDERSSDRSNARGDALLTEITAARDWIGESEHSDNAGAPAYYQALAVAENAVGRATYLLDGGAEEAITAFERALSLVPELGDAHVNLATALLRRRSKERGWEVRVRRHLDEALELSPQDRKALYLLGKVALQLDEQEEAVRWFKRSAAQGEAWAMYRLAELHYRDDELDLALDRLQQSLTRQPDADVRARLLVLWTSQAARRRPVEPARLAAARRAGDALERDARRRRADLSESVSRALRVIDALLGK